MVQHISIIILIAAFHQVLSAEIIATTSDGKKVILTDDGRWRYKETVPPKSDKNPTEENSRLRLVELIKNDPKFDFRKVRWGMSKNEVLKSEDAKLLRNSGDTLAYEMTFMGYTCSVLYAFSKGSLTKSIFLIKQSHVDPALFFRDYDELKKYLAPMYGNATSDKYEWKNDIYKKDKSKWGFAISIGFLVCRTEWHNNRTRIELKILGGNHQITTELEYSSTEPVQ